MAFGLSPVSLRSYSQKLADSAYIHFALVGEVRYRGKVVEITCHPWREPSGKVNADNDYHLPEQSSGTPLDPREFAHESIE